MGLSWGTADYVEAVGEVEAQVKFAKKKYLDAMIQRQAEKDPYYLKLTPGEEMEFSLQIDEAKIISTRFGPYALLKLSIGKVPGRITNKFYTSLGCNSVLGKEIGLDDCSYEDTSSVIGKVIYFKAIVGETKKIDGELFTTLDKPRSTKKSVRTRRTSRKDDSIVTTTDETPKKEPEFFEVDFSDEASDTSKKEPEFYDMSSFFDED